MPRIMRQLTLWTKKEIEHLFKTARRVYKSAGLIISQAPKSTELARLLIIIPKKVGSAPQRNLIRRRIKAIFYEHKLYENPVDWIFFVKPLAKNMDFSELQEVILSVATPGESKLTR